MSKLAIPIATKISRVYQFVALIILIFYGFMFKLAILGTENKNSMHHLSITAPHHFQLYQQGFSGTKQIDPLLTIYDDYASLPHQVKRRLPAEYTGIESFHFEDDSELAILAKKIVTQQGEKVVWAVLNIDATEWNDESFILIELLLLLLGILVFLSAGIIIKKIAERLAKPFVDCAEKLNCPTSDDFSPVVITGEVSQELADTLQSINTYRSRIQQAVTREKNFTRYISHEIRTPMTVIKGCTSLLKRDATEHSTKQLKRITTAVNEMESLTNVFLLLARQHSLPDTYTTLNEEFINSLVAEHAHLLAANACDISIEVQRPITLNCEPLLLEALIKNLVINAINCTENGKIVITVDNTKLIITDSGIGLGEKPRGYEGFGIGLILVKDICQRYHWQFQLTNNPNSKGCSARVTFSR